MNEHPILFTGEMVKAILDGRKTVTRRVIKPQPVFIEESFRWRWGKTGAVTASREWWNYMDSLDHCPYGQPGDLLWVRETWAPPNAQQGATEIFRLCRNLLPGNVRQRQPL